MVTFKKKQNVILIWKLVLFVRVYMSIRMSVRLSVLSHRSKCLVNCSQHVNMNNNKTTTRKRHNKQTTSTAAVSHSVTHWLSQSVANFTECWLRLKLWNSIIAPLCCFAIFLLLYINDWLFFYIVDAVLNSNNHICVYIHIRFIYFKYICTYTYKSNRYMYV